MGYEIYTGSAAPIGPIRAGAEPALLGLGGPLHGPPSYGRGLCGCDRPSDVIVQSASVGLDFSAPTRGMRPPYPLIKDFASIRYENSSNQPAHGRALMAITLSHLGACVGSGSFQLLRSVEWLPAVQCNLICSLVL